MKQNFRFDQERDSDKKQYKQEVIEYILNEDYGVTLFNENLARMLHYDIEDELEYYKFKSMMTSIKSFLITKGKVLKGIPGVGYYILKPSQVAQHCYRTYVKKAGRMYDKSAYILDRTDKTGLSEVRLEEMNNMMELNKQLIDNAWNTIKESPYYSRKDYYDSLND